MWFATDSWGFTGAGSTVGTMASRAVMQVYTRLSRAGLQRLDRPTARFAMGTNHYLLFAVACALPFVVALLIVGRGALWPAALVHVGIVAAWVACAVLNAKGLVRLASVLSLVVPLVGYGVQTWLLSYRAGFMLPLVMTSAVSFVTVVPRLRFWRIGLSLVGSAAVVWSFLDLRVREPRLDASSAAIDGFLVANVALATFIIGSTSWLNDHYFTRERARAERQILSAEAQARTDPLTRLANRRGMVEELTARTAEGPYAIAVVDLDRFKEVNDRLGHATGDVVLTEVARILDDVIGDFGVVSRWGGEEFLILIPDARLTAAVASVERARRSVEELVDADGKRWGVTFSAGLAAASQSFPWEIAIRVADALLYDAKDAGRNRVRYAQVRADIAEWDG